MKHLGDVTKISGREIEPVDVITFGSPCQDMSVAGKQDGLSGERSSLFFEAIRIIREMRDHTDGQYPRFAVWENVPGAFSSNGGKDFRAVLEAFCSIGGYTNPLPNPPMQKGMLKWRNAGTILGDCFSLAWRILDAQYWGVPQRRRRVFLMADFAGGDAGEILFDTEGLLWNSASGGEAREAVAADATGGVGGSCKYLTPWETQTQRIYDAKGVYPALLTNNGAGQNRQAVLCQSDVFPSLTKENGHMTVSGGMPNCVAFMAGQGAKARGLGYQEDVAPTLKSTLSGGNTVPTVCHDTEQITNQQNRCSPVPDDPSHTLLVNQHPPLACVVSGNMVDRETACNGCGWCFDTTFTLNTVDRHAVAFDARNNRVTEESGTLQAKGGGGYSLNFINPVCYALQSFGEYVNTGVTCAQMERQYKYITDIVVQKERKYIVRRLTPVECARLQGFPDCWGIIQNKKLHSDSAEYRMWGNGVALPCVSYVLRGIAKALNRPVTMGR